MSAKIYVLFLIICTYSCALHPTSQVPQKEVIVQVPKLNIPLPASYLTFPFPQIVLHKLEAPRTKITTEKFSTMEINHVRAKDKILFAKSRKLTINTDVYDDDEFVFPLPGAKIISPYGGKRRQHTGIDLKTCANDTIVSTFDGIVRMAKPYSAYGNVIVIRHYNGLETVYSHNSKNLVKSGDAVKAGTPIALTGRTGRASTEHLHFEIRINGEHFNPAILINFTKYKLKQNRFVFTLTPKGSVLITPASIARPTS